MPSDARRAANSACSFSWRGKKASASTQSVTGCTLSGSQPNWVTSVRLALPELVMIDRRQAVDRLFQPVQRWVEKAVAPKELVVHHLAGQAALKVEHDRDAQEAAHQ